MHRLRFKPSISSEHRRQRGNTKTRVFRSGEEITVFIHEEFDIRIDDAPQETHARPVTGGLLAATESAGVRTEGSVRFFHFKAIAAGIEKVDFPPTMLVQKVEIQNPIGVSDTDQEGETLASQAELGGIPFPLAGSGIEPDGISPTG